MTRLWQTGIGILAAFMLVCGPSDTLLGKKTTQSPPTNSTQKVLPVKAVRVKKGDGRYRMDYPGVVLTNNESTLSFRVSGMIEELPIRVGQVLEKGQLIARLDNDHFVNAREQARAATRQAKARMQDARAECQRLTKLRSVRDISKQKLQHAETSAKAAEENFCIAQKRLAEVGRELGYTRLTAPFDGVVASKKVHAFQTVEAGQTIALMVDPSDLLFRVQLPTSLLSRRKEFHSFKCIFPALNGLQLEAKPHGIGPSALPPLHTFPLTVELGSATQHSLMPGTEGILRITAVTDASKNHILVPVSAITSDHNGSPKVWIADPKSGRAHPHPVTLGGLHQGMMVVTSGLSPGDRVITAGQTHLSPGRKITIVKPMSGSR
ncbi:efflux RND transporter periplasmic adaptor subunit [Desulfoplanes sp.]